MNSVSTFIFRFNEFIAWNIFLRLFTIFLFRDFFSSYDIDVLRNHFFSRLFNWFVIVNSVSTFIFRFNEFITRNIFLRLFTVFLLRNFFSGCDIDVFRNHFLNRFFYWFVIVNSISTFIFRFNEFITRNIFLRLFTIFLFRNFFSSCDIDMFRNHFLSRFFRFLQTTRCHLNRNRCSINRLRWFRFLRLRCFRRILWNFAIIWNRCLRFWWKSI